MSVKAGWVGVNTVCNSTLLPAAARPRHPWRGRWWPGSGYRRLNYSPGQLAVKITSYLLTPIHGKVVTWSPVPLRLLCDSWGSGYLNRGSRCSGSVVYFLVSPDNELEGLSLWNFPFYLLSWGWDRSILGNAAICSLHSPRPRDCPLPRWWHKSTFYL